ncbi:RNA polymerase sigma factor [Rothia nasisuis]|uniref:RNA polymerase sigma factor n=1 Tax=Rothia nasisuis TaxID=2109647 RepID=UPI001F1CA48E|nr:sigma-70 family RNA polymerase sigma factor [Rothia nasisuis]
MTDSSQHQPSGPTDQLLCQRAIDGDEQAFQILVRRYLPLMRAYALRLTGSTADADDALQETLLQAWQKLDTLQNPSKVKSWLMTLTGRKSIDLIRARAKNLPLEDQQHLPSTEPTPETQALISTDMQKLTQVLKKLPEQQQRIWLMREFGGSSYREIAEALNITTASVRGQLARARVKLLEGMEGK